ncbi:cyanophycinase [Rheinheimera texasensis]|uniref:cyanophycinase n=1 Tax=Rheinheimera texasensis TaxID=306205 RepID=UPI0004E1886F|nr:cyanophycinase [Rheinheimera texasensis]
MLVFLKRPAFALPALTLLLLSASQAFAAQTLPGKELWLFGGGERICSSVEPEYCETSQLQAAQAYFAARQAQTGKTYRCDKSSLQLLQQLPHWPVAGDSETRRLSILQALRGQQDQLLTSAALDTFSEQHRLSGDEYSVIEDSCEVRPQRPDGSTARMAVYWPGTYAVTQHLFQSFVTSAQQRRQLRSPQTPATQKPRLLLITASSYNPYEWVDYYQQLFSAAGADVDWLPLEPALSQQNQPWDCKAIEAGRLKHSGQLRRAERYPELAAQQQKLCADPKAMAELIERADAVFINGGDQSLTLRALTGPDGKWLALTERLLQRVRFEAVPLGGSSAGNAVQSGRPLGDIAMISGGRSAHALQFGALAHDIDAPLCRLSQSCGKVLADEQLTYRPQGGLQLFSLGIADTHFRERNREGRLLTLVQDAKAPAGFGVDEATVLRARFASDKDGNGQDAALEVLGSGAVWVIDRTAAQGSLNAPDAKLTQLKVSRLLPGDVVHWQQLSGTGTAAVKYQGQLSCGEPPATDAAKVDSEAYAPLSQPGLSVRWQLGVEGKVAACQRSDGRWHYLAQPLSLQLNRTQG